MTSIILCAVFTLLQVGDVATSYRAFSTKAGHEGNPLVQKLIDKFGLAGGLIIAKMAAAVGVWGAWFFDVWHGAAVVLLIGLTAFYAFVVFNNYRIIKKGALK